jgi:hydroxymethylbilane synthase
VRIGTRASPLARRQTETVAAALRRAGLAVEVVPVVTEGDRDPRPLQAIGGRGLFTARLEEMLLAGELDLAVHSLKDVPLVRPEGVRLWAVPAREDPRDALVTPRGLALEELPPGARVGTASPRRQALLGHLRPDLEVREVRGNVGTRLGHLGRDLDALVLAEAGLRRGGHAEVRRVLLPAERFVPAPGQGALAVEGREGLAPPVRAALLALDHPPTRRATALERRFLGELGGGCAVPVGAFARAAAAGRMRLTVFFAPESGTALLLQEEGDEDVAARLAARCLAAAEGRG